MIGIVTTLATATCANCHGEIRQTKSDLSTVTEWVHEEGGRTTCPGTPVAEPVLQTITREPGIEVVECKWGLKTFGEGEHQVSDWVAVCPRCGQSIARAWGGHPQPSDIPIHLHKVDDESA